MTHGYLNRLGEETDYNGLLRSGVSYLEAVATDWIFGTTPAVPPAGGTWWEEIRRRRILEDEELILIGG